MSRVDQTIFVGDQKRKGNCVAACVATALGLPLEKVPHGPDMARCRLVLSDRCRGLLDYSTVTADRITTGSGYERSGLQPSCAPCQSLQGALVSQGRWPLEVA